MKFSELNDLTLCCCIHRCIITLLIRYKQMPECLKREFHLIFHCALYKNLISMKECFGYVVWFAVTITEEHNTLMTLSRSSIKFSYLLPFLLL